MKETTVAHYFHPYIMHRFDVIRYACLLEKKIQAIDIYPYRICYGIIVFRSFRHNSAIFSGASL